MTAVYTPSDCWLDVSFSGLAEKKPEKPKQLQEPGPDFKTKPGEDERAAGCSASALVGVG